MTEIWKSIPNYPTCEASTLGRVRYKAEIPLHWQAHRIRPQKITGFGYYQVTISGKTLSVHNLVASAFIGPSPGKHYRVDHINENKLDNRPENLRWITHTENVSRAKYTGNRSYFYEGELWLIKKLIKDKIPYILIGKMFQCSTSVIQAVKKGLKDSHLKESLGP